MIKALTGLQIHKLLGRDCKSRPAGFELFLNEFSLITPEELKVIVLDNGAFHKAKRLKVPQNIILVFLPPFRPELNPAEKMWAKFKRAFINKLYKSLQEVSLFIQDQTQNFKN